MHRALITYAFKAKLTRSEYQVPLQIQFANGHRQAIIPGEPEITIHFRSRLAEWSLLFLDHIGFVESFIAGQIDLKGDRALEKLLRMYRRVPPTRSMPHPVAWLVTRLLQYKNDGSRGRNVIMRNLNSHYGLPAAFFHRMTGELYGYTEGYIEHGSETQNEAQFKKYDYMCRKLCLQPGDRLVEVGTAWGSMALIAAKKYGATVTNYGVVKEQNRVFAERIQQLGLEDQITNVNRDALQLGEEKEQYDKYVSLGVLEHAGYHLYDVWIKGIADCLKPGGIGVITFTGYSDHTFIDYTINKYIWRGCYLPKIGDVIEIMEDNGLNVVDVEDARFHYADTMQVMLEKLNEHWEEIQCIDPQTFNKKFHRMWNLYYRGAIESFYSDHSKLHAYQLVFTKGRADIYPRTRAFLYEEQFTVEDMGDYEVPRESVCGRE